MTREPSRQEQILEAERKDYRRRRRERIAILVTALLVGGLVYLAYHFSKLAQESTLMEPFVIHFFTFAVWALLLVLTLILIFLIVRNVVKFFFERRRGVLGSKIRMRLVMAFMMLTLGPATVLFILSTFILNTSIEHLYEPHVLNVVKMSKSAISSADKTSEITNQVLEEKYNAEGEQGLHFGKELSRALLEREWIKVLTGEERKEKQKRKQKRQKGAEEDKVDGTLPGGTAEPAPAEGDSAGEVPKDNGEEKAPVEKPGTGKPPEKEEFSPEEVETKEGDTALCQLPSLRDQLKGYIKDKRLEYNLEMLGIYGKEGKRLALSKTGDLDLPGFSSSNINKALSGEKGYNPPVSITEDRAVIYSFYPVPRRSGEKTEIVGAVVVGKVIPWVEQKVWDKLMVGDKAEAVIRDYTTLQKMELPIKSSYFLLLVFVTLIVIFLAVWFGFYMAKGITEPIQLLSEGTAKVASGNLDYRIDVGKVGDDEMSRVLQSFNKMTDDLQKSRNERDQAYKRLREINEELEQRRRYMETVLAHIGAGVMSIDPDNRLSTVNPPARQMLGTEGKDLTPGKPISEVLKPEEKQILDSLVEELANTGGEIVQRQVTMVREDRSYVVLITLSRLRDAGGRNLGIVLVADDMTELIRAHRAMAWREVARRIAHEIKNPLTPIKLSAQRLERRFSDMEDQEEARVFSESVNTIIAQTDELKKLVNEFSLFARLPSTRPVPENLHEIIKEVLPLYRDSHPSIGFRLVLDEKLPELELDREQMKRVFINLLDNAVSSINDGGEIAIETAYNQQIQVVRIEIRDTGCGIPAHLKDRLFDPYYSTKEEGSGLGLTIVQRIISDHYGYIRVMDNEPAGTKIVIELPVILAERQIKPRDFARTM
ncbi:MAG: ATP-binding protein [bacterium]